jgi:hypothetical protein
VALDPNCINNVNEFYSHHYLDALLDNDLKGLVARWDHAEKEENRTPPYRLLSRCSEDYFKAKARAAATATVEDRYTETHLINVKLAEALGYSYQANEYELIENDQAVPVLASLERDGNPYLWLVEAPFADEDHEPLKQRLVSPQMPIAARGDGYSFPAEAWEDLLSLIFRREQPPRWVMLLAGSLIFLVERHKWGQGKYLLGQLRWSAAPAPDPAAIPGCSPDGTHRTSSAGRRPHRPEPRHKTGTAADKGKSAPRP